MGMEEELCRGEIKWKRKQRPRVDEDADGEQNGRKKKSERKY